MQGASISRKFPMPVRKTINTVEEVSASATKWSQRSLIGKIIEKDPLDLKKNKKDINISWRMYKKWEMETMGTNLFVFKFEKEGAAEEIMKQVPWTVMEYLMILQEYDSAKEVSEYDFTHQVFCVQFRNLKLEHLNDDMVDKMCSEIGKKMEDDPENERPKVGKLLKANVEVDITKPLRRGTWMLTAALQEIWVIYHYEKQPRKICPKCFVLQHDAEHCKEYEDRHRVLRMTTEQWNRYFEENKHLIECMEVSDEHGSNMDTNDSIGLGVGPVSSDDVEEDPRRLNRSRKNESDTYSALSKDCSSFPIPNSYENPLYQNQIPNQVIPQISMGGNVCHTKEIGGSQLDRVLCMDSTTGGEKNSGTSVCYSVSGVARIAASQILSFIRKLFHSSTSKSTDCAAVLMICKGNWFRKLFLVILLVLFNPTSL
ncbi:hypothetical protein C5167_002161 [Papaver somniferum]|uniref:DUF4283 domain-containing protein n=1 Tax=Papaver somniferum TaxID=3469 RepID=A0A4Y7L174_PAPSO|nr:hypothetical protein C5167_002161 [Papaver somniferum]